MRKTGGGKRIRNKGEGNRNRTLKIPVQLHKIGYKFVNEIPKQRRKYDELQDPQSPCSNCAFSIALNQQWRTKRTSRRS